MFKLKQLYFKIPCIEERIIRKALSPISHFITPNLFTGMSSACLLKKKSIDLKLISVCLSAVNQTQPCLKPLLQLSSAHYAELLVLSYVCQTPNCSQTSRSHTMSIMISNILRLKWTHLFQVFLVVSFRAHISSSFLDDRPLLLKSQYKPVLQLLAYTVFQKKITLGENNMTKSLTVFSWFPETVSQTNAL